MAVSFNGIKYFIKPSVCSPSYTEFVVVVNSSTTAMPVTDDIAGLIHEKVSSSVVIEIILRCMFIVIVPGP